VTDAWGGDPIVVTIEPELWVDRGAEAITFYRNAFGAEVLHRVGEGQDVVAQLAIDEARFWIATSDGFGERLVPRIAGGATGRLLLVVDNPDAVLADAVAAGATLVSPVADEHAWRIGRVADPFGHEWEIGAPTVAWPPGR
jgi:PhnB protein